jgi:hypothetical protein
LRSASGDLLAKGELMPVQEAEQSCHP